MVTDVTKGEKNVILPRTHMDSSIRRHIAPFPSSQISNPSSFWNGLRPKKEKLDAMRVDGLGVHDLLLPVCLDKPDACKAWNPLFLSTILLRAQTLSPIVPGSLSASQCTYSSKKEAPGQHSGIAEAKIR